MITPWFIVVYIFLASKKDLFVEESIDVNYVFRVIDLIFLLLYYTGPRFDLISIPFYFTK